MRRSVLCTFPLAALGLALLPSVAAGGEKLQKFTVESRVSIMLQAPEAAVKKRLPPGWELDVSAQGPYGGSNLGVNFIEYLYAADPAGKPMAPAAKRFFVLTVPVKNPNGKKPTAMAVGGWVSDPSEVPGAWKNFTLASEFRRARSSQGSGVEFGTAEDSWFIDAGKAGSAELRLRFNRSMPGRAAPVEMYIYSATDPKLYLLYHLDLGRELVRSVPAKVDRAQEARLTVKGPAFADLFDGSEKVIAIHDMPWWHRQTFIPE